MKKTYLLAASLAFYAFSYAQYTPIPDAAFEQQLITAGVDTEGVLDGQILTSDANNFSGTLGMSNVGIADLTGIEAFTNMTGIVFEYNLGITNVDLSSCTALQLVNGVGIPDLTTVNLSGLVNLKDINFTVSGLTTLDVTSNIALESIKVRGNSIASLDLSQNVALTNVDVKKNALTFLDLRNGNNSLITNFDSGYNVDLVCIYVDDMFATYLGDWIKAGHSNFVNTELECITLSVASVQSVSFNMYPNPTKTSLFVSSKTADAVLAIYNITGKVVLTKTLIQGENNINISSLATGIYLARFISNNQVDTKKLIIQ